MSRISAVVPVKVEQLPKQRLSGLLSDQERVRLSLAMLEDVLAALRQARSIGRIVIVTRNEEKLDRSLLAGVEVLHEPAGAGGLNRAAQFAAAWCAEAGDEGALILHHDVPLLSAQDVETIVAAAPAAPSVTLVPARDLGGTNALLTKPPDLLTYQYGPDSFRKHLSAAASQHFPTAVLDLPNVALDIDHPDDLAELLKRPGETRTQAFLRSLQLSRREAS